jgi:chromate transporter
MLALAATYATLGVSPIVRGALYGLGPVVLAIFVVAIVRLGASAMRTPAQRIIAVTAAIGALATPLGTVAILFLAAAAGVFLFHARRLGAVALLAVVAAVAAARLVTWSPFGASPSAGQPSFGGLVTVFSTVGALTFGGGLSMIALLEEHLVGRLGWLTPEAFIAGLALGQLTPGPVLMIAAYVGYTLLGLPGALAAIVAVFLPSFVLMLAILPAFDRVRALPWAKAVIQGIAPAVIGVMAVALTRMAPHAVPDAFAFVVLVAAVAVLLLWRLGPVMLLLGGAMAGLARARLCDWPAIRAVLCAGTWAR